MPTLENGVLSFEIGRRNSLWRCGTTGGFSPKLCLKHPSKYERPLLITYGLLLIELFSTNTGKVPGDVGHENKYCYLKI
jgi:hypothetical protein